jgi:hypothetical protein
MDEAGSMTVKIVGVYPVPNNADVDLVEVEIDQPPSTFDVPRTHALKAGFRRVRGARLNRRLVILKCRRRTSTWRLLGPPGSFA